MGSMSIEIFDVKVLNAIYHISKQYGNFYYYM